MLILVVDDDAKIRGLVCMVVERAGYEVETLPSAVLALEYLKRSKILPNLVISDHNMPGMTGMELLRAIKTDPCLAGIRFVLMTGGIDVDEEKARAEGVNGFLEKPFNPQALGEMILRLTR